jgi:predicted RNA-binding protein YlxR (DUF448 family)
MSPPASADAAGVVVEIEGALASAHRMGNGDSAQPRRSPSRSASSVSQSSVVALVATSLSATVPGVDRSDKSPMEGGAATLARAKTKPGKGGYVCSKREATQELKNRSIDAQAMSELREHAVPQGQRQIERGIDRHAAQMAARLPRDGKHRLALVAEDDNGARARGPLFDRLDLRPFCVVAGRLLPPLLTHRENGLKLSPADALVGRFERFEPARARACVVHAQARCLIGNIIY